MSMVKPRPMPSMEARASAQEPRQQRAAARSSALRRVGEGKRAWQLLYGPWLAFLIMLDPICRRCRWLAESTARRGEPIRKISFNLATEGHHPFGQLGALILVVLPFCRGCHDDVHHKHPKQARKDGWIRDLE